MLDEDEWKNVVFIDLPTGQVSWHIHKDELVYFPGLPTYKGVWDGHTVEEKYDRVKKYLSGVMVIIDETSKYQESEDTSSTP